MIDVGILYKVKKGRCLVVGHGESVDDFPWYKVENLPKLLVNFYDPKIRNVIGVVCWDTDILKEIFLLRGGSNTPVIFYSGAFDKYAPDVYIPPVQFPPVKKSEEGKNNIFSGARALYLAQFMGYEEIYLVGYDFIPHTTVRYGAQKKEVDMMEMERKFPSELDNTSTVLTGLFVQMECFKKVKWLHDKVYQTNKNSNLKLFTYKLPGELK